MSIVHTAVDDGVMTITLADEENRNVLGTVLVGELLDAMSAAEGDEAVRVVVLTNSGSVFCAGADLRQGHTGTEKGRTALDVFTGFHRSRKPYIGRIAGHCVAGGMGLAAAMDIAIAVDHAKMGFTEVRIGAAPAMISVLCLPKMRRADAAAAFLRGGRFLAPEAARLGLINAAVPEAELDTEVRAVVDDLLLGGPGALAATKRLLYEVPEMSADDAFDFTGRLSAELFRSDEARAGMSAYLEKRTPPWAPSSEEA